MHRITSPVVRRNQRQIFFTAPMVRAAAPPRPGVPAAAGAGDSDRHETGDPLVSVIIPSYNHARFIREAINSVANQTYKNIELIIIDDGSKDDSVSIIKEAIKKIGSLKTSFFVQENCGAHNTINRGLKMAQGEYIAILNSDDIYYPDRIEKLLKRATDTKCKFIFSKVDHISSDGRILGRENQMRDLYLTAYEAKKNLPYIGPGVMSFNLAYSTSNFFMHRSIVERVGFFRDYKAVHDWDYLLRVLLETEPCLVDEPLMAYRVHEHNTFPTLVDLGKKEEAHMFANYAKALAAKRLKISYVLKGVK